MKYDFKESDFKYLHEVIGVIWNGDGEPLMNGIKLTDENLSDLLKDIGK
jgi:hypothetical protein